MNSAVDYAITTIKNGYAQATEAKLDKFICPLTKSNQGFSYHEIQTIKAALSHLTFDIPTHISVLPKGKKITNNSLFDGLQTIYAKNGLPWWRTVEQSFYRI